MDIDYDLNSVSSKFPHFKDMKKSTISETFRYLNKLIEGSSEELENIKEFISSDKSLPLFEERLRLLLIDSLRLENEVVKIFLSQNDYQITKVLGFKWFFQNLSSDFCIKELFPFISVSARCKIINRLSKHLENVEEAQKYFEFIRNKYDNDRANYLLPRCSPEFILSHFEKTKLNFNSAKEVRIFLNICKRYPEIGVQILSSIFEIKKMSYYEFYKYKKVLLYLSGNHPDLIVPFLQKHHSHVPSETFGIRLTKKLGSKLKGNMSVDFMKSFIFNEKFLFPILSYDEQVKHMAAIVLVNNVNLTFYNWINSSYRICELLKLISAEERLKMIESVFKEVYDLNFNDHSKCWTSEILELLQTAIREPYLKKLEVFLKAEKTELKENVDLSSFSPEHPEKIVYLYDSNTAFEKFKEILRKCPTAARRERILPFLVKNCSINNDLQKLQEVVEFIGTRHRNDDYSVIHSFVNAIDDCFPPSKLNPAIFEKLEDVTYFLSLNRRSNNNLYAFWKKKHIHYRLENNLKVDAKNFFESIVLKSGCERSFMVDFSSKQSKAFILAVCDEAVRWIRNKPAEKSCDVSETLLESLITTCREFNEKNKRNRIFLRDVSGLEEIIKRKAEETLADLGAQDWPLNIWEIVFASQRYGKIVTPHLKPKYLSLIIKRNPELIEENLERILKILFSSHLEQYKTFFISFLMSVSFWEKTEKVKEIILNEFKNGEETHKKKNALRLYSCTCTIEEFSAAVENYLPKQERVEQKNDDFDEIQILIPSLIKNVKPRWKNLELILKFFFGDFLKSVLPSLSACCYHARCDFVLPFLKKQLISVPQKISYKKDIIRLIVELSDREGRADFFLKCWDEYSHYSVRSILLMFISKSFLELPSRETFRVLEKCISESDEMTIESRPLLLKIPNEFFSEYISALWRFSEGQEQPFRNNFRQKIFWCFNENNFGLLSTEFCESIIKNMLFNSSDIGVESFTALYLASEPGAVARRVKFVLDVMKTRQPNSQSVFDFLNILIAKSQEKPSIFADVFEVLLENWPEFPLGVLFKERLLITYHSLHCKLIKKEADPSTIPVELGRELKIFFSKTDALIELVFIYAEALKKFFEFFKTSNAVLVVKELLAGFPSRTLVILAILSLPGEAVTWHKREGDIFNKNIIAGKKVLNEIFKTVEGCNDRIAEIYMRSKFDSVKPEQF